MTDQRDESSAGNDLTCKQSQLPDLLDALRNEGDVDSAGWFTLDAAKAKRKIRDFQFEDPYVYCILTVSAAVGLGASEIRVKVDGSSCSFAIQGVFLPESTLRDIYSYLFSGHMDALHDLALAFVASQRLQAEVLVETWSLASSHKLVIDSKQRERWATLPKSSGWSGDKHTVIEYRFGGGVFRSTKKRLNGAHELAHLSTRCRHCPTTLLVNGKTVKSDVVGGLCIALRELGHSTRVGEWQAHYHTRAAPALFEGMIVISLSEGTTPEIESEKQARSSTSSIVWVRRGISYLDEGCIPAPPGFKLDAVLATTTAVRSDLTFKSLAVGPELESLRGALRNQVVMAILSAIHPSAPPLTDGFAWRALVQWAVSLLAGQEIPEAFLTIVPTLVEREPFVVYLKEPRLLLLACESLVLPCLKVGEIAQAVEMLKILGLHLENASFFWQYVPSSTRNILSPYITKLEQYLYERQPDPEVRRKMLSRIDDLAILLSAAQNDPDPVTRYMATVRIGVAGGTERLGEELLREDDPYVRRGALWWGITKTATLIEYAEKDPDPGCRLSAVEYLEFRKEGPLPTEAANAEFYTRIRLQVALTTNSRDLPYFRQCDLYPINWIKVFREAACPEVRLDALLELSSKWNLDDLQSEVEVSESEVAELYDLLADSKDRRELLSLYADVLSSGSALFERALADSDDSLRIQAKLFLEQDPAKIIETLRESNDTELIDASLNRLRWLIDDEFEPIFDSALSGEVSEPFRRGIVQLLIQSGRGEQWTNQESLLALAVNDPDLEIRRQAVAKLVPPWWLKEETSLPLERLVEVADSVQQHEDLIEGFLARCDETSLLMISEWRCSPQVRRVAMRRLLAKARAQSVTNFLAGKMESWKLRSVAENARLEPEIKLGATWMLVESLSSTRDQQSST